MSSPNDGLVPGYSSSEPSLQEGPALVSSTAFNRDLQGLHNPESLQRAIDFWLSRIRSSDPSISSLKVLGDEHPELLVLLLACTPRFLSLMGIL